jgi:hypothetical protein
MTEYVYHRWFEFLRQQRVRSVLRETLYLPLHTDRIREISNEFRGRQFRFASELIGRSVVIEKGHGVGWSVFSGSVRVVGILPGEESNCALFTIIAAKEPGEWIPFWKGGVKHIFVTGETSIRYEAVRK